MMRHPRIAQKLGSSWNPVNLDDSDSDSDIGGAQKPPEDKEEDDDEYLYEDEVEVEQKPSREELDGARGQGSRGDQNRDRERDEDQEDQDQVLQDLFGGESPELEIAPAGQWPVTPVPRPISLLQRSDLRPSTKPQHWRRSRR
jgi:hypothetical protein